MEEEILLLNAKKKTGMLRILFSRIGLVFMLILVQIALVWIGYYWLEKYLDKFAFAQILFSIAMIIYLFNCDMDSSGKLTWMFLIMLVPVPATILLFVSVKDVGHGRAKKMVAALIEESRDKISQDSDVINRKEIVESGTDSLSKYLCLTNKFPIYENTKTKFFPIGEEAFESMLEELSKAEKFIFMEYFIIDEGYMWGKILKILADKAAQGVDVRVLYDGMCEVSLLPRDYPQRMAELGIKCRPFTPLTPFVSTEYNYRDHRKILVIDGKVAYNGGINLADEYINKTSRFGHWKDTAVMLKGEAVKSFTLMFLQMWNLREKRPKWDECYVDCKQVSDGYVMPYGDSPLDGEKVGEMVYMDVLNRAKNYVYIMTPYLILDNELETALKYAAKRGVDVRLILPGRPDKYVAYSLAKSYYRPLVEAGVKIYEYTPGFVHSKLFVSDDEKAVVGTINLDYRSLYHHFECATYMFRTSCIKDIVADYEATLTKCREVTLETIKKEKFYYKAIGAIMRALAPLM